MNDVALFITSIVGLFTIASLLAVAWVALARASYAKATIEALRGDIADRDRRIDFLEDENERKTAALTRQGTELEVLRDLVTNKKELSEFVELARAHETKADARHHEQIAMDEQILRSITELHQLLDKPK